MLSELFKELDAAVDAVNAAKTEAESTRSTADVADAKYNDAIAAAKVIEAKVKDRLAGVLDSRVR